MSPSRRRLIVGAIITLVFLGSVWTKVRVEAGLSLAYAQDLEQHDADTAITVYRQTIRWYSPFSTPTETAVLRLAELGVSLEKEGRPESALMAWRALRSGLYSIRWLVQPYQDQLPPAEDAIARLMADQESPSGTPDERAALTTHHRELLAQDPTPDTAWSLLAVLAFVGWATCLFLLALQGFDDVTGRVIAPIAIRWGLVSLVTFGLWMAGLAKA
ncbi:MAG: hypothetical protein ACI9WU_001745 [Myxococcota bacterium]